MGTTCLTVCPECSRHLRCEERACPFCGARISSGLRVLEYRIKTQFSRAHAFSLGASLTLAGFVSSCEQGVVPVYGAPCNPPSCPPPSTGGNAGAAASGGHPNVGGASGSPTSGGMASAGVAGMGGSPAGTAGGGTGGDSAAGNAAIGGEGGAANGTGGESGDNAAGAGGDAVSGASGQGGEGGQAGAIVGAPVTVLLGGSPQDAAVQLGGTLTVTVQLPEPAQGDTTLSIATTSGVVPATVTVATGSSQASFQYTPAQEGSHQISITLAADTSIVNVLVVL